MSNTWVAVLATIMGALIYELVTRILRRKHRQYEVMAQGAADALTTGPFAGGVDASPRHTSIEEALRAR
jgi:hypothetical protein